MLKEVIEGFRLSPQQEHLWLLQKDSEKQTYRAQCAILIEGVFEPNIFTAALQDVINRHEILRTTFYSVPGMTIPVQVITVKRVLLDKQYNLSNCTLEEQEIKTEEIFNEFSQIYFDFENTQVLHTCLVILSPNRHMLLISMSAMLADSITLKNFVYELSRSYSARLRHEIKHEDLSSEPLQYADFSEWQNELLEADETEVGREYWRKQNLSAIFNFKLPYDKNQPNQKEFKPHIITSNIAPALISDINVIIQSNNSSIFVYLLACWQILLWRLINQSDVIVGTLSPGRNYSELKDALGLFAKYLPLHSHFEENINFNQSLQQVDESVKSIFKWQDSFNWQEIQVESHTSNELFFCPFSFEFEEEDTKYHEGDVSFSIHKKFTCIDRFKIKLSCRKCDDSIITEFHYDPYHFDVENIERLVDQFHNLLLSVTKNPQAEISKLNILSDCYRRQLLFDFNQTQAIYSQNKCIHQLFEEQVEQTPSNIAIAFADQELTYAVLNARANKVAQYLRSLGVKPGVLVGICVERSSEMIIGILGILKAGAAYVPLDPAYPQERLEFILEDTQVPVLLTQQRLLKNLPINNVQTICLDTGWETITQESSENPTLVSYTEDLAYIIYTSGSTGKPKGVKISHRNLVSSTTARIAYYQEPVSKFLLLSSYAFDSSVAGIFWTLCSGGTLYLPFEGLQREVPALIDLIAQNRISHLLSLPSLYFLLLQLAQPEKLASLRTVIVAGEACPIELVERQKQLLPKTPLFNEYGPTEATVWSSVYRCQNQNCETQVSIGHPIANTQIYILDSHLHPVPLYVAGELYVGGDGLAQGYQNCPDLTAAKFIPNPFSDQPGARLYKTGDNGRYLPDGNIEFLGRIDHQVKIRGYRIELSEIEAVLSQNPQVQSVVVIARDEESGHKRLVAYIVPHQGNSLSTSELRHFLADKLPEYMVPSIFIQIKTLPQLPNGKVDIKALPAPDTFRPDLSGTFVAPQTPVEKILAEIWTQVLRVEQIGIYDNFFELGGDSITSIQIVARANDKGLQLSPKQLFAHQTIAELAAVANITQTIQLEQEFVTRQMPLTPIQQWFFEQNLVKAQFNKAILFEAQQVLRPTLLVQVMQQLLAHHDALRLRFVQTKSGWQQLIADLDEVVPFTRLDFSLLPEVEQESAQQIAIAQLQTSLNLLNEPLARLALFDFGEQKPSRLLVVIHNLIVDNFSWQVLMEDFQTAYNQVSQGKAIHLPSQTTSFQQWATYLSEYAQSADLNKELDYWFAESRRLVKDLPLDFPEANKTVATTRTLSVALSVAETQTLIQEVPKAYQTLIDDVLLTALTQAFKEWTENSKLLVDLERHGREQIFNHVDLSRTLGRFTSIFPILLDIEEALNPAETLKVVKEQLRCVPNQGIGYGILRYLNSETAEQLQAIPQAQVKFHFLNHLNQFLSEPSIFVAAREFNNCNLCSGESPSHLLDIGWFISDNQLQLDWKYNEGIYRQATIENLIESFMKALRSLINHCQSTEVQGYTPSDFPKANLTQKELDKFLAKINAGSKKTSN